MACGMLQKLKLRSEIFLVTYDYVRVDIPALVRTAFSCATYLAGGFSIVG